MRDDPHLVSAQRYSLTAMAAGRRVVAWREIVDRRHLQGGASVLTGVSDDFDVAVSRVSAGGFALTDVRSRAHTLTRTPSAQDREGAGGLVFAFAMEGSTGIAQRGREGVMRRGDFAFFDEGRPVEMSCDERQRNLVLHLPARLMRQRVGRLDHLAAVSFSARDPLNSLAFGFVERLMAAVDGAAAFEAERLFHQAVDILALAISRCRPKEDALAAARRNANLYRLKIYLEMNCRDPNTSLGTAAFTVGISTRHVNGLLAREGTSFGRLLLEMRLEGCRRDLANDALLSRSICEVGFSWGFNDHSHFSRMFRRRYGRSPREWRHEHLAARR